MRGAPNLPLPGERLRLAQVLAALGGGSPRQLQHVPALCEEVLRHLPRVCDISRRGMRGLHGALATREICCSSYTKPALFPPECCDNRNEDARSAAMPCDTRNTVVKRSLCLC